MTPPAPDSPSPSSLGVTIVSCIIAIVVPVVAGGAVGFFIGNRAKTEYAEIRRPTWSPPQKAFGPVWTVLYALMGLASWFVWRSSTKPQRLRNVALALYAAQLVVNLVWSPVYFLGYRTWALALIFLLDALVLFTILAFMRISVVAGLLLVPYALWLCLATALNAWIVYYN
jgi:tryptophan-rich sensory protein